MRMKQDLKVGVLVISHGSRSGEWVRLVDDAVEDVRLSDNIPVVACFLELVEDRLIQNGIDALELLGVTDIVVIPLFVSSGSTHVHEIAWALGVLPECETETDLLPFRLSANVRFASPIDEDPIVAQMIWSNVRELSVQPERELLMLVSHGSGDPRFAARWTPGMRRLAERVRELGGFAEADAATLLPDVTRERFAYWQMCRPELDIIVAPLFVSEGYFTKDAVPGRLAGLPYRYNGKALLPNPLLSRWIERQVLACIDA
jgi:sirohydrochlorin ferrochelatase